MKFVSWNVNGLRACLTKGFAESFAALDADIFCIQETKMQPGQAEFAPEGYRQYWYSAEKKGYSGTAVFSRLEPLSVTYGIGKEEHSHEGRAITLEFENFYLVNVYTPNAQKELARIDYRLEWEADLLDYLKALDAKKPVVYCGDLNVAHNEIDLKNPKTNHKNAGFTDQPGQRRFFRPGAPGLYPAAGSGLCRQLPHPVSRPHRGLFLVELYAQRPGHQRGMAHRLFRHQPAAGAPAEREHHPL